MGRVSNWRRRVWSFFHPSRTGDEIAEEMRLHMQYEMEKYERAGMSRFEARRRAILAFGSVEVTGEEMRAARSFGSLEEVLRDLRHAVRSLGRTPGFTAGAVLTLRSGSAPTQRCSAC